MAIDYRYHVGSLVSVFVALLLGILIGIGLAPKDPEQLDQAVSKLQEEYKQTRAEKEEDLKRLRSELDQSDAVAREAVAAVTAGRLSGRRIAIVLSHDMGRDLPNNLRAALTQAGATVTSTTTLGRSLITLSQEQRDALCKQLLFYPPSDQPVRPLLAKWMAHDFLEGAPKMIPELRTAGMLTSTVGSTYDARVDGVVVVGGMDDPKQAAPEQLDVPFMKELRALGIRVVGCETKTATVSTVPLYKAIGAPTVDHIDTPAGRLSLVLTLAGVNGNYGVRKETADRLLPVIPPAKSSK